MSKAKPTLVLIHGFAANQTVWGDFAFQLAQHYPVMTIDLPGYGTAQAVPAQTLHDLASHVLSICPKPAIWVGWSLGGQVARYLAALAPKQTQGLITLCSNPKFVASLDWPGIAPEAFQQLYELFKSQPKKALTRFFSLQGIEHHLSLRKPLLLLKKQAEQLKPEVLLRDLTLLQETDLRKTDASMLPELNIFGNQDRLVPIAVAPYLKDLYPQAQNATICGATHVPFLSHVSECLTHMDTFIHDTLTRH